MSGSPVDAPPQDPAPWPGYCPGPCGAYLRFEPCYCHLGAATIRLIREMYEREWRWETDAYNYWARLRDPDWEDVPF